MVMDSFEFVLQEPNVALSAENRSKIRRHAMRAVGAARLRQGETPSAKQHRLQRELLHTAPLSGLELLVKDFGLDPMDLSALSSVHIGKLASAAIQSQPSNLGRVLSCRQRSFLAFVPPRFGHCSALDDAFRCLVTAAHSTLVASAARYDDKVLAYHGKAIRSIQAAVGDARLRQTPEIICAVSLLALFEILNPSSEELWDNHIAGVSLLFQLRGPEKFSSDFDKALLTGLLYPISAEALLHNKACFLDDPAWADATETATVPSETFTDRSPLGIALMLLMAKIPGLAKRTSHAVSTSTLQSSDDQDRALHVLATDVRSLRSRVIMWRRDFNTALIHAVDGADNIPGERNMHGASKRYELLGISLVIHILASRMLVSLSPPQDPAGLLIEDEVQAAAGELKQVQASLPTSAYNHRADFFLGQKAKIAEAALATHDDFQRAAARVEGRVIEAWVLRSFCERLGRKCCDGINCCP